MWLFSFDPKQETNDFGTSNFGTSNSVFSSVELEIGAIISLPFIIKLPVGMR